MHRAILISIVSILILISGSLFAQKDLRKKAKDGELSKEEQNNGITVFAEVIDGDTFPVKYLPYVAVVADRKFTDPAEARRWARLKRNVKKVYPYAKLASKLLQEYADEISEEDSRRKQKKYYKEIEEKLKEEYGDDMRDLTSTQGTILIKLIDREIGETGYDVVKEFRGGFTAFFWQGFARMFGQDLKSEYDPNGADRDIETVVQLIESGQL